MIKKPNIRTNTVANFIGQFYAIFIGILILPLYLSHLGPEPFGLIGFFTMLNSWLMLLDIGLSQTIQRESARLRGTETKLREFKLVLRSVEFIFLIIALIISFSIFTFSESIARSWLQLEKLTIEEVSDCIKIMGFMFASKWLISLYKGALDGFERQVWTNLFWMISNSFRFIGGFLFIIYISSDITNYFIYQLTIFICELLVINRRIYNELPKQDLVMPSFKELQRLAPFAFGIAFTSSFWILVSQIDKFLLSNILTLKDYGYFSLVVVISSGIMMLSAPIGIAIRPRLTFLVSENQINQMLSLYKKATKFVAVISFPVIGITSVYSRELLFIWTGNPEAAEWGATILSFYALASGLLIILSFQFYLQFAYGNLKYHVRGNLYFGVIQILCMAYAAYNYGALGTAITWFLLQFFFTSFWPGFIHKKFAPGLHLKWLKGSIFPPFFITAFSLLILSLLNFNLDGLSRIVLFGFLTASCGSILLINIFFIKETRRFVLKTLNEF